MLRRAPSKAEIYYLHHLIYVMMKKDIKEAKNSIQEVKSDFLQIASLCRF